MAGCAVIEAILFIFAFVTNSIQQTLSVKLSWSHYCELLLISEDDKRSFYEKECINAGWSVRELKRQMETSLFERLLLSSGTENKERVLMLCVGVVFYTQRFVGGIFQNLQENLVHKNE